MASVNKVILVGNLGRDPEVRYSPDGAAIANFSIATTSRWKDKGSGEQREETEWHRCVAYNRLAEIVGEYLRKGSSVYVEGRLKTNKWQDKETGADRYSTDIVVAQLQMLNRVAGTDGEHGGSQGARNEPSRAAAPAARTAAPTQAPAYAGGGTDFDDDIPFRYIGAGRSWACI